MGRPKKPLISRRATLEMALKIVDEEGLDALSIRRLGRELNIQGISLYHHFQNKDEILAGVCQLALASVRTPKSNESHWRDWLLQNALNYRRALNNHPNLISVLMRRHPLRIGLAEHNATAGLLAVQGVPPDAIMPLMEALEEIILGSANYQSAVDKDDQSESWKQDYQFLYHLSQKAVPRDRLFEVMARAVIDAIAKEYGIDEDNKAEEINSVVKFTPAAEKATKSKKLIAKKT
jgi:TetR/AcrR family tetracycline transcriptional repressor